MSSFHAHNPSTSHYLEVHNNFYTGCKLCGKNVCVHKMWKWWNKFERRLFKVFISSLYVRHYTIIILKQFSFEIITDSQPPLPPITSTQSILLELFILFSLYLLYYFFTFLYYFTYSRFLLYCSMNYILSVCVYMYVWLWQWNSKCMGAISLQ